MSRCPERISISISASVIRQLLLMVTFWACVWVLFSYFYASQQYKHRTVLLLRRELLQEVMGEATVASQQKEDIVTNVKISITKPPFLPEINILKLLSKTSNLPLSYIKSNISTDNLNGTCKNPPNIYDLDFNNIYWQRARISKATFFLFNAYYDKRKKVGKLPFVRLIGMIDKLNPPESFCRFWYLNGTNLKYLDSEVTYTYMWYDKWGNYKDGILQPFIMSCHLPSLPSLPEIPDSVSIVGKKCQKITNNMKIMYRNSTKREDFAVCVKGLDFLLEDLSVRLVEWIEMLGILGAKKIFFYELEVHPNVSKVLSYYVDQGLVELTSLTLPGKQPNLPGFRHLYLKSKIVNKRQNELIPYNDCLYKNLYSYKYLALLDIDEIIMPLKHQSWKSLMDEILTHWKEKNSTRSSYDFMNTYFLDHLQEENKIHEKDIPMYFHMLQHVYRSNYTSPGSYVKCFHDVDEVVSLHNHFPRHCFGECNSFSVNISLAHLQHYRRDCVDALKEACDTFKNHTTRDTSIWRFKDELIRKANKILFHLNFYQETGL